LKTRLLIVFWENGINWRQTFN